MQEKIGIIFNSGIGNALTMIPLIKQIRIKHPKARLVGWFMDRYQIKDLFESFELLDQCTEVTILNALKNFKCFKTIYIDWLSCSRTSGFYASFMAQEIITHENKKPRFFNFFYSKINTKSIQNHWHIAQINKALIQPSPQIEIKEFFIPPKKKQKQKQIAVQLSCGNNKTPYKQWPTEKWTSVIRYVLDLHYKVILLGDQNELHAAKTISSKINHQNLKNKVGRTTLPEFFDYIQQSILCIGQDSSAMHMAAVLDVPSLTIWGGSNPKRYGYARLSPKHQIISLQYPCAPCNDWLSPNTTKTSDPNLCPDFACIKTISASQVIDSLKPILDAL